MQTFDIGQGQAGVLAECRTNNVITACIRDGIFVIEIIHVDEGQNVVTLTQLDRLINIDNRSERVAHAQTQIAQLGRTINRRCNQCVCHGEGLQCCTTGQRHSTGVILGIGQGGDIRLGVVVVERNVFNLVGCCRTTSRQGVVELGINVQIILNRQGDRIGGAATIFQISNDDSISTGNRFRNGVLQHQLAVTCQRCTQIIQGERSCSGIGVFVAHHDVSQVGIKGVEIDCLSTDLLTQFKRLNILDISHIAIGVCGDVAQGLDGIDTSAAINDVTDGRRANGGCTDCVRSPEGVIARTTSDDGTNRRTRVGRIVKATNGSGHIQRQITSVCSCINLQQTHSTRIRNARDTHAERDELGRRCANTSRNRIGQVGNFQGTAASDGCFGQLINRQLIDVHILGGVDIGLFKTFNTSPGTQRLLSNRIGIYVGQFDICRLLTSQHALLVVERYRGAYVGGIGNAQVGGSCVDVIDDGNIAVVRCLVHVNRGQ